MATYKVVKGTKDIVGNEYELIQNLIQKVEKEFISIGGKALDTPVFERTDVLLGKYGEEADTKLIYRLADEGGELLALRYDLTIPFTRYIKENKIKQMRRYSIGKVYRRDQPNIKAGRYREFIQADFDIYGEKQEGMLAEATLLNSVSRILKSLGFKFKILINDVRNIQYILNSINVKDWRKICPIIDKLDKQTFESLKCEFTEQGLTTCQVDELKILLEKCNPMYDKTISDYDTLYKLADVFGFSENMVFTNSLARGLDYYTGFIWEFKVENMSSTISAGGRYDNLLGAPSVGISIGISRLSSLLSTPEEVWNESYFVTSVGNVNLMDKLKIIAKLKNRIQNPILYTFALEERKLNKIIADCCQSYIRYVIIIGESEMSEGKIIIKDLKEKTQRLDDMEF